MGDDTVFDNIGDADAFIAYLRKRGYTWTIESEEGPFESQNFCSTKFVKNSVGVFVPIPLNWEKNVFALSHPEKGKEEFIGPTLMSLCTLYAFDEERFIKLHGLLAAHGGSYFRSKQWFQAIVTGFEGPASESLDMLQVSCPWTCLGG
jgi:hypothetical protein